MYLSVVFLFNVGEEGGIAEVALAARTFEVPGFDGDEVIVERILHLHGA